jgi:hypothetical protein
MWLVFGAGSKKKPVKGGMELARWCARCGATRTFIECEIEDKVDVFFVSLFEGTSRRLVCCECGEDVELPASGVTPPAAAAKTKPAPATRGVLSEKEKDALLAALKKKMKG